MIWCKDQGLTAILKDPRIPIHRDERRGPRLVLRSLGEPGRSKRTGNFVRCHKSFVVNLDRVKRFGLRRGSDYELQLRPPVNK